MKKKLGILKNFKLWKKNQILKKKNSSFEKKLNFEEKFQIWRKKSNFEKKASNFEKTPISEKIKFLKETSAI